MAENVADYNRQFDEAMILNWGSVCQHNSGSVSFPPLMKTGGLPFWIQLVVGSAGGSIWSHVNTELYISYLLIIVCLHISKCSILHDGTARIDPCVVLHSQCHLMKDLGLNWMHPACCSCLNCTRNYLVTWDGGSILGVDLYTVAIRLYCFNNESDTSHY